MVLGSKPTPISSVSLVNLAIPPFSREAIFSGCWARAIISEDYALEFRFYLHDLPLSSNPLILPIQLLRGFHLSAEGISGNGASDGTVPGILLETFPN